MQRCLPTVFRLFLLAVAFGTSALNSTSPIVAAAELRTYQFISGQDRLFHFQGGLADVNISAQLAGSFDIEIEEDGASIITRFDVWLHDILDEGGFDPGWSDGQPLADILFESPVGLTGMSSGALIELGVPTSPVIDVPLTITFVTQIDSHLAYVRINSLPESFLDSPNFHTTSPGFLA